LRFQIAHQGLIDPFRFGFHPLVMSSEVETSLDVLRITVRDSSTPLGMTKALVAAIEGL
jgi:hypothetical protein